MAVAPLPLPCVQPSAEEEEALLPPLPPLLLLLLLLLLLVLLLLVLGRAERAWALCEGLSVIHSHPCLTRDPNGTMARPTHLWLRMRWHSIKWR